MPHQPPRGAAINAQTWLASTRSLSARHRAHPTSSTGTLDSPRPPRSAPNLAQVHMSRPSSHRPAGATASSLAATYGAHEGTVRSHARKAGVTRPDKVTGDVVDEYAAGMPAVVLAERCGVSVDTITRHARLAGITPPARSGTLPQDQVDQIVESYARGERIAAIGGRLGMGHRHVRAVLVAAGIQVRPKGRPPIPANTVEEITRLRHEGWSFARIGTHVGMSASTVRAASARHRRAQSCPEGSRNPNATTT
jgi:hypothetical protein